MGHFAALLRPRIAPRVRHPRRCRSGVSAGPGRRALARAVRRSAVARGPGTRNMIATFRWRLVEVSPMPAQWEQIVIDADDPARLARWWAEALGYQIVHEDSDEVEIRRTPE